MNDNKPISLEERKLKEIEHSRKRRSILQGSERIIDAGSIESQIDRESLILDPEEFRRHYSNMKYYSITSESESYYFDWIKARCGGKKALDYCCGNGEHAIFMAKNGAEAIGIDISPEGIRNCKLNAEREGLGDLVEFRVMDGENMDFDSNTFDVIVVYGALHHLCFEHAMKELCRVIKPDGEIICIESLRHNPIIHLYRRLTPHLRSEWEIDHILTINQINKANSYFEEVNINYYHLFSLLAVSFRKTVMFRYVLKYLNILDRYALKYPFIGRYAWMAVFTLSKAKKECIQAT